MKKKIIHRFGCIRDHRDTRDRIFLADIRRASTLPTSVDLTNSFPPVYDQGDLGSCTANAIAGALEYERKRQNLLDFVPSRLFLYYNERAIEGTTDSDSGAQIRDGIKSVAQQGDCPETEYPYIIANFAEKPPLSCYQDALQYKALQYKRVSVIVDAVRSALAQNFPVIIGITVYDNFPMTSTSGKIPLPKRNSNIIGGHAMVIIGYCDLTKEFMVRNSWGTGWGVDGNGTIPYDYIGNQNYCNDFWVISLTE